MAMDADPCSAAPAVGPEQNPAAGADGRDFSFGAGSAFGGPASLCQAEVSKRTFALVQNVLPHREI